MSAAPTWTIRSLLSWCEGYLQRHGDEAARRAAEVLVAKACGMERLDLYLNIDKPLTPEELAVLREDVRKRAGGMPLQYLTGTAPFRYLELKVAPGVLIPRPETEVLVSEALALLPAAPKPQDSYDEVLLAAWRKGEGQGADLANDVAQGSDAEAQAPAQGAEQDEDREAPRYLVADICTGSGCIACSLASEHPRVQVVATDIAEAAIALARENVALSEVSDRVSILQGDLGSCIDASLLGTFDMVVSNPPYVPTGILASLPKEVGEFEPALALDGGEDGLAVFRRLAAWALQALKPGGHLLCELHEECLAQAAQLAQEMGYAATREVADLAGRPRVLIARKA